MLDATTYRQNITAARLALSDAGTGPQPAPRTTRASGFTTFTVTDDTSPLTLIYTANNLYIEGFQKGAGPVFLHKNSGYSITPGTRFSFGNEYKELSYDRLGAITVTLDNVNGALGTAYNAKATTSADALKRAFLYLAIAFAEAVRFDDVLDHIIAGTEIDDLDWTKHKDQTKICVIQSAPLVITPVTKGKKGKGGK
jgi:hypothetical protein